MMKKSHRRQYLFHELGHAIHARHAGGLDKVPPNILQLLKELCIPKIDELTSEEQSEVFADILSAGLMYDSPYEKYDPFQYMHECDKKYTL